MANAFDSQEAFNNALMGLGIGLMTPRSRGGGVAAGLGEWQRQMYIQQQLARQREQDERARQVEALNKRKMEQDLETGSLQLAAARQAEAQAAAMRQQAAQIRDQISAQRPDLLPLFDMDQKAAIDRMYPKPGEGFTLSPGAVRYGADGKPVAENPRSAEDDEFIRAMRAAGVDPASPKGQQLIQARLSKLASHPAGVNVSYGAPFPGVNPSTGELMLYQAGNRGGPPVSTGLAPPPVAPKEPTEGQTNSFMYANRAMTAHQIIEQTATPGVVAQKTAKQMSESVPIIGGMTGLIGNASVSANAQQLDQAERNFVNAVLRKESGAVINPDEFNNARKQYFPQPGDSAAVIKQKAENRRQAIQGLTAGAGPLQPRIGTPQAPATSAPTQAPATDTGRLRYNPATGRVE